MTPNADKEMTGNESPLAVGTWEGIVVARNGATLPPRCIKCNGPAFGKPVRYTFVDSSVGGQPTGVLSALKHFMTRRKGVVFASLCRSHRRERRMMYVGCPLLIFAGVGVGVWANVSFEKPPNALVTVSSVFVVGGLFQMGLYNAHNLKAAIDGEVIRIAGAGPNFVASIRPPRSD
jgi:hypothetical protein